MKPAAILLALTVAGCGTTEVYRARDALLGRNVVDLVGCAGVPDHIIRTAPDEILLQYDDKPTASKTPWLAATVPLLGSFQFGQAPVCHAHFRVLRDGTVAGVSFSGATLADDAGACAGLISECLIHPDQTELPRNYDAMAIFLGKK